MSSKAFLNLVKARRSFYNISSKSTIEPSIIKEIIDQAVLHVPSAYNVQGARVIILLEEAHRQLWSVVRESTLEWLPKDNQAMIKMQSGKIDGFQAGYGTILILEDEEVIKASYERAPQFKGTGMFESWTEASSAMLQFIIWTALEAEGLGASLQHHTSMVTGLSSVLHKTFDIPENWTIHAMMPFGVPTGEPGQPGMPAKTFKPLDDRVKMIYSTPTSTTTKLNSLSLNGSASDTVKGAA